MMPTDTKNTNKFMEDLGEEKSISPTFRQLQLEASGGGETASSEKRNPSKQYIIVGFVLAVSAGLLWFMRGQAIGVDVAEGTDIKIDYEVDEKAASSDTVRQREVLFNLELSEDPVQVPAADIHKNPFAMATLTGVEPEPTTKVADGSKEPEAPRGPTPEEIREAQLDRLAASLELNTVLRGRVSLARINGKTYRIGDAVESEFILLSIEDRTVTLGADGISYILELDSN